MIFRFSTLIAALAVGASSIIFASAAKADVEDDYYIDTLPLRGERIDQAFDRIIFGNDREAFKDQTFPRNLNSFFGFGVPFRDNFPENEITRDARAIHRFYVEVLEQQNNHDPVLRTPDLPNPYNTSLLQLPGYNFNRPVRGIEFYNQQQLPR